ncbi:hypothetical protein [Hymenobacter rubidus]|uniref:hypothetical protein n=1 Tax=Hymenobacter rubidus TaxID=1441626 RepID=UPI00191E170B|nr:hypothetical protein [Hymenobacter rubidus]
MNYVIKSNADKVPLVIIDPELNKLKGTVLFPEKVATAKQAINRLGLPVDSSAATNNPSN